MSADFWDLLLTALEEGAEPRWLARQGRWWLSYREIDESDFDLFDWAQSLREDGFEVELSPVLLAGRRGQPEAMRLLLRCLCNGQYPALNVSGDGASLCLSAAGFAAQVGPLAVTLAERLNAQLGGEDGHLFSCPCPSTTTGPAPVDRETLVRSTMGDTEFEKELIETFLEEGRRQFASLSRNYAAPTLHSLKGSAAMVGALRLADLLGEQEHALEKQRLPLLQAEFARVVEWLEGHLEG